MARTDWKSALAALGASDETAATDVTTNTTDKKNAGCKNEAVIGKTDPDRKKRVGVVYSTNAEFDYSTDVQDVTAEVPKNRQQLRIYMERAGRNGKTVTLVKGYMGSEENMNGLCKLLKQKCGVGGAAKDGEIIIQGDHRQRLLEILKKEGYTQTK